MPIKVIDMNKIFRSQKGFSVLEAILAVSILAIVSMSIIYIQNFMSKQSVEIKDKAFATEKAIQIMEELRSLVSGAEITQINVLDDYNDGSTYSYMLTSNQAITDPGNPLSGNIIRGGKWKYLRNINVLKDPNNPYTRRVTVDIYRNSLSNPGQPAETLAETVAILRTITANPVPTQVLDVYIIEIQNVPGWWSDLSTMSSVFDNVLQSIELLNPGLIIRPHLIHRLAYGRDQEYYPYINEDDDTNDVAMPYVYFYPGHMRTTGADGLPANVPYDYYLASMIGGRLDVDNVRTNAASYPLCDMQNHAVRYPDELALYNYYSSLPGGDPEPSLRMLIENMNSNPAAYKNAIIVNLHGELMPLPPMRNYSDAAKSPAIFPYKRLVTHPQNLEYTSASNPVTLRVYSYRTSNNVGVLGQYYSNAFNSTPPNPSNINTMTPTLTRYDRNINFDWCGSGNPVNPNPPDPSISVNKFVVRWTGYITPEYSENYTFYALTDDGVNLNITNGSTITNLISDWNDQAATMSTSTAICPLTANSTYYVEMDYYQDTGVACAKLYWSSAHQLKELVPFDKIPLATVYIPTDTVTSSNITVQEIVGGPDTAYQRVSVDLSKSTSVCTVTNPAGGGTLITLLDSPIFNSTSSASNGGLSSANTLYGLEYIPCPVGNITDGFSNDLVTSSITKNTARWVITFAANSFATGMHTVETRIGSDLNTGIQYQYPNLSRTYFWVNQAPPVTEQYQFMGDPRHCPYLDVKQTSRYNWWFTSIPNTQFSYSSFSYTTNGWNGNCDMDIPRYFQIYRQGLLATESIWTTMNGFSYYYVGMGGEFGMDKDPFYGAPPTGSLPFINQPWNTVTDNSLTHIDEILNGPVRLIASTDLTWFAKNWIGELYQDQDYATWTSTGNVPTGPGNYWRTTHTTAPFNNYFNFNRSVNTGSQGCESFYNGQTAGNGSGTYGHDFADGSNGDITALGLDMSTVFSQPLITPISAPRPFNLNNSNNGMPPEWNNSIYSGMRTTISIPTVPATGVSRVYYTSEYSSSDNASAVVQMVLGSSTCYVSANGLSTQSNFGTIQMGGYIVMNMIRSFLDAGLYTGQSHIPQLPYVQITNPLVTSSFNNATTSIPITWTISWLRWDGNLYTVDYTAGYSESTTMVYNVKYFDGANWRFCSDGTIAQEGIYDSAHSLSTTSYTWNNLSGLTKGVSYILCVEAYRQNYPLHYGYDQVQFSISQ